MSDNCYYSNKINDFIKDDNVIGELAKLQSVSKGEPQYEAWINEIEILKVLFEKLKKLDNKLNGTIAFEYVIPLFGARIDNVIIINGHVFIVEFKTNLSNYANIKIKDNNAAKQVDRYRYLLENFHSNTVDKKIKINAIVYIENGSKLINKKATDNLAESIYEICKEKGPINDNEWLKATFAYGDAIKSLMTGSETVLKSTFSEGIALDPVEQLIEYIENKKDDNKKQIFFVTGVPGAGKTLAGLMLVGKNLCDNSVYVTGNLPLYKVFKNIFEKNLDVEKKQSKTSDDEDDDKAVNGIAEGFFHTCSSLEKEITKDEHYISYIVFDEAQRAWSSEKVKKGRKDENNSKAEVESEPATILRCLPNGGTVVALIGMGQEIYDGECGISEWLYALQEYNNLNPNDKYEVYIGYDKKIDKDEWYNKLISSDLNEYNFNDEKLKELYDKELKKGNDTKFIKDYGKEIAVKQYADIYKNNMDEKLHLGISKRAENYVIDKMTISEVVEKIIDGKKISDFAKKYQDNKAKKFEIYITRDLTKAKNYCRKKNGKFGIIASSRAKRLSLLGINTDNSIDAVKWFEAYNGYDPRNSNSLEFPGTEFSTQGMELDYVITPWAQDYVPIKSDEDDTYKWIYKDYSFPSWTNCGAETFINKKYIKNTYRVILTRARKGMIIYIPDKKDFYNAKFLKKEIEDYNCHKKYIDENKFSDSKIKNYIKEQLNNDKTKASIINYIKINNESLEDLDKVFDYLKNYIGIQEI